MHKEFILIILSLVTLVVMVIVIKYWYVQDGLRTRQV